MHIEPRLFQADLESTHKHASALRTEGTEWADGEGVSIGVLPDPRFTFCLIGVGEGSSGVDAGADAPTDEEPELVIRIHTKAGEWIEPKRMHADIVTALKGREPGTYFVAGGMVLDSEDLEVEDELPRGYAELKAWLEAHPKVYALVWQGDTEDEVVALYRTDLGLDWEPFDIPALEDVEACVQDAELTPETSDEPNKETDDAAEEGTAATT